MSLDDPGRSVCTIEKVEPHSAAEELEALRTRMARAITLIDAGFHAAAEKRLGVALRHSARIEAGHFRPMPGILREMRESIEGAEELLRGIREGGR